MITKLKKQMDSLLNDPEMNPWWRMIEQKLNWKREKIIGVMICLTVFSLILESSREISSHVICTIYPIYASLKSVDTGIRENQVRWILYWILYVMFSLLEYWRFLFSFSIPFYSLTKSILLCSFMLFGTEKYLQTYTLVLFKALFGMSYGRSCILKLNPSSNNVQINLKKQGSNILYTTLQADNQGQIDLKSIAIGEYGAEAFSSVTTPLLTLRRFCIKVPQQGTNISFVDLESTMFHVTFKRRGLPFSLADVTGMFIDKNENKYQIRSKTDKSGVVMLTLPEGIIQNFHARKDDIVVQKIGNLAVSAPEHTPVNNIRPPRYIIIEAESSSFTDSVNPINDQTRVVILGDVSLSMESGNRMNILRKSFGEILEKCLKNNWKISLGSWNIDVQWCTEQWIRTEQKDMVHQWIMNLQVSLGNDMELAISDCMLRYHDVTDVYIMCDGDITPFTIDQGRYHWATFRNRYPDTKFHFIALGSEAAFKPMEIMAIIGGGTYTVVT